MMHGQKNIELYNAANNAAYNQIHMTYD